MIKEFEQLPSTNTWAKEHSAQLSHGDIVVTHSQSAGRGQRGNSWEAEPGKNLTFTLFLKPAGIAPSEQFVISEIVALAVANAVRHALAEAVAAHRIKVKWPNDIYVDDRKIAGILIEHSISASGISHTIVGIGLNVNQTEFRSDAPNPVSLAQLAHKEFPLLPLLTEICDETTAAVSQVACADAASAVEREAIHNQFVRNLWRHDGEPHPFALPDGTTFHAVISHISPDGSLSLLHPDGSPAGTYRFKEVAFVL